MPPILFAALLAATQPGDVAVAISGLTPNQGHLDVQLCTADEFVKFVCTRKQKLKVTGDGMTVVFHGIPAGRYAVMSYQDLNDDGHLGRDLYGRPKEPWGYSGKPVFMMGPPSFDSVAFDAPAQGVTLSIRMAQ